jgi:2-iminobutanoate/2-iminopropanoate deaminase
MQKHIINPWQWQDNLGYAQAIEVKNNKGTLYCSGQAAIDASGKPVAGNMSEQITLSLQNLAQVVKEADYQLVEIVRLTIYTTSIPDFFTSYGAFIGWMKQHNVLASCTLVQVAALAFPELKVEIEATVVA